MEKNEPSKPTIVHQLVVVAFGAVLLWTTVFYWWYYTTRRSRLVLVGTLIVIPVPFVIWLIAALVGKAAQRPELRQLLRALARSIITLMILGACVVFLPRLATGLHAHRRIFNLEDISRKRVAIVFGAGVTRDGRLTPQLHDRVTTAAELYLAGKVDKLLMSGDNRFVHYNEPAAMREHALRLGVPDEAIVLDYAGRRTYDTCYRARDIFQVRDVVLVTQQYHLPRALYTCNTLGVKAIGIPAERGQYSHLYDNLRELPATALALWQVHVSHPVPVLGKPEPVFTSGSTGQTYLPARSVQIAESRPDGAQLVSRIKYIVEKPADPPSDLAVVGVYMYPLDVFDIIAALESSARGELEITDVNNVYVERGEMAYEIIDGWWLDAGEDHQALLRANLTIARQEGIEV